MHFLVKPATLNDASVTVPGDKSISHRAIMLGSVAVGETRVSGFLAGEDCLATMSAFRAMGVEIDRLSDTELVIHGKGLSGLSPPTSSLDLGNSGTAMRLMAGLMAGQPFGTTLVGDASLSGRPMGRVIGPLEQMGASIGSNDGKPPLQIAGGAALQGIDYTLPVASAQVKSAVLLAGLYASGTTSVREPATTRDHTERMLRAMGVPVTVAGGAISVAGGRELHGIEIAVPADLSSAAFIILAVALSPGAEVRLEKIGVNPTRTGVIDILRRMGANIELENESVAGEEPVADLVVRASKLHGIDVDPGLVSLAIDEFPVLFVAAAAARGTTRFSGIGELRVKESDRIAAMAEGLKALGIRVDESDDGAVVHGGQLRAGTVQSFGDHRIAMAFAAATGTAEGPVSVQNVKNVATSFPGFDACMRQLGADISIETDEAT
jgi:3-phosphoshikimate 1-carboxyvinyltransferase